MPWQYSIAPGFVARMKADALEVRNPDTDEWIPKTDRRLWESIIQDGTQVTEADAQKAYEMFKRERKHRSG